MVSDVLGVRDLTTGYHDSRQLPVVLARELTAELSGGLVCLLGPNSAGKSTLLNTLSGALRPLSGRVLLGGDDVHSLPAATRARRIGVVLTDRVATGLLTSYQVVCLGRHPYTDWLGRLSPRDHEVAEWALESTGASHLKNRWMAELSDGERQRVLVARALAQEPEVLLLDEVTAFVDLPHRVQLMRLLRAVARSSGTAVLLSTHDLDLALRTADRLWVLTRDSGLAEGGPEDLVLSGVFESAFRGEGIEFDRAEGSFRMHADSGPSVSVVGDGVEAVWTRRAVERVEGRGFTEGEIWETGVVVLVNRRMARRLWPGRSPLALRIKHGADAPSLTIVGVAGDVRQRGLDQEPYPQIYVPYADYEHADMTLALRTRRDPKELVEALRKEVAALDPGLPLSDVMTLEEAMSRSLSARRLAAFLLSAFSGLSLVLAVGGVYATLAYSISRRVRELGLRLAMGARPSDLMLLVTREGMGMVGVGLALGSVGALAAGWLVRGQLFGVSPLDVSTLAATVVLILTLSLAGCLAPAGRAARLHPLVALREE
jgi:iron complex transport system ATP-binding protein